MFRSRQSGAVCKNVILALAFGGLITVGSAGALAQTGSRIGPGSYSEKVFWFGAPNEFREVRKLINAGKAEEAIEVAEGFLVHLRTSSSVGGSGVLSEYYAMNALCVALTAAKRLDDAATECTDAIARSSGRWQAFNSRGVVYHLQGRMDEALEDYRRALELAPSWNGVREMVRRNIELAENKKKVS